MTDIYTGACHCGAIGWEYRTTVDPTRWPIRSCQCAFCRAHGARCTSDPKGRVDFRARDPEALTRYRFGLETADFLVCRRCGVYVGALIERPEGAFATLNLNVLETPVPALAESAAVSYSGEDREERVARRLVRWTPVGATI